MATSPNLLLEGNLGAISLPNLVQLIALEQKNAYLSVNRVELGQTAEMAFRNGQLIFARVNQVEGNNAMYRIIGWWNSGTFRVLELAPEEMPEPNVTARMDFLLLEGMRQMDANAQYRALLPTLTSAVSFTPSALESFRWDTSEPAEWIPLEVRQLPRSFSIAQLHQVSLLDEMRLGSLIKMLLATHAVRIHTAAAEYDTSGFEEGPKSTRYEAFAQLIMEYVGYEQAYGILDSTLDDLGWDDIDSVTFSQLIDLADRIGMALMQQVDRKQGQDAMRRLRARVTSLL
ncbi:MAG TPA: DUF4388 domain-containing protein [Oscillatoriaceae cyanobacterium]